MSDDFVYRDVLGKRVHRYGISASYGLDEGLDILHVFWAGWMSALTPSVIGEMVKLREEGKVRAIGTSIHDRKRAARLAAEGPLDFFMIRYNAAHPGAEVDIFPHLPAKKPFITAYTATSWRKLLTPPRGWDGPAATPGDCYRFCLSNPNVDRGPLRAQDRRSDAREHGRLEQGPALDGEDGENTRPRQGRARVVDPHYVSDSKGSAGEP